MGGDKALLEFDRRPLLTRMLELGSKLSDDVRIVGSREKLSGFGPVIEDLYPEHGPLGGIHAALGRTDRELSLVLAVDLPFLKAEFLAWLIGQARLTGSMVTVPRGGGGLQPLCAVYRRDFRALAENALAQGKNKIDSLFTQAPIRIVEDTEIQGLGFSPSMFDNLNTPADLEAARGRLGGLKPPVESNSQSSIVEPPETSPSTESAPQSSGGEAPRKPYIEFKSVSKSFGSNCVLDDVSFEVLPGETVCILGRSGVGKSVSLHHIMGFLKPDSGRVIVAYEDITDYAEPELQRIRKKVTMVFQNGALFDSLTVGENVAFPLRERGDLSEEQIYQIVDGLLEMVGVKPMRDLLPSDLSTGMKRSVAIARALAAEPECVLYDEPTTMVDPLMAQLLGDLIQKLKYQLKLTSVVVTHDMRLAKKLADRVVFLHEARVLFFGTVKDMQQSDEPIVRQFLTLDELHLDGGPAEVRAEPPEGCSQAEAR